VLRTGLLREPAKDRIDFPHRTFQEYLAACAAGYYDDVVDLAKRSMSDQWHETIILAAGTPVGGSAFGNRLIEELLRRSEELQQDRAKNISLALALACLETGKQIRPDLEKKVLEKLSRLVPPRSDVTARQLSAAGDALIPHLLYTKIRPHGARALALSAHAIARVGTSRAVQILTDANGYGGDDRRSIIGEICTCSSINPLTLPSLHRLMNTPGAEQDAIVRHALARTDDISPLQSVPNLSSLNLSGNLHLTNFSPLNTLTKLTVLDLDYTRFSDGDVEYLTSLHNLQQLSLRHDKISDVGVERIAKIKSLRKLAINFTGVTDAGAAKLIDLTNLMILDLFGTNIGRVGLSHILMLPGLASLSLGGEHFDDRAFEALATARHLKSLAINAKHINIESLAHLTGLSELKQLILSSESLNDSVFEYLDKMPSVTEIQLGGRFSPDALKNASKRRPTIRFLYRPLFLQGVAFG
jgi:hypothetical protein